MSWSASAPGRLDVMGGIADYSGSLVLQMPIDEEATCELTARQDRLIRIQSESRSAPVAIELDRLIDGDLSDYESARRFFAAGTDVHWASYVAGVILVLIREEKIVPPSGIDVFVRSDVPEGKGVSSSAALEVAAIRVILKWLGRSLPPTRVAVLCQMAENQVAGAPCGIMDQMTAACGERGKLLRLLCQPAELQGLVELPDEVSVWGVDSGIRHAVTGSDYTSVRAAAFMGLRIIEEQINADADTGGTEDLRYLANVSPEAFSDRFRQLLPESMSGRDFIDRYDHIRDDVVKIHPAHVYRIRACTSHPVLENARIHRFAGLLEKSKVAGEAGFQHIELAGKLMYESHSSYGACGLGSGGTDRLVELVKSHGKEGGLFGARITGGGSGGTVAILGLSASISAVRDVAAQYQDETGRKAQIFQSRKA